jgi:hypothetical protein
MVGAEVVKVAYRLYQRLGRVWIRAHHRLEGVHTPRAAPVGVKHRTSIPHLAVRIDTSR